MTTKNCGWGKVDYTPYFNEKPIALRVQSETILFRVTYKCPYCGLDYNEEIGQADYNCTHTFNCGCGMRIMVSHG